MKNKEMQNRMLVLAGICIEELYSKDCKSVGYLTSIVELKAHIEKLDSQRLSTIKYFSLERFHYSELESSFRKILNETFTIMAELRVNELQDSGHFNGQTPLEAGKEKMDLIRVYKDTYLTEAMTTLGFKLAACSINLLD